jgi:hypothetical protein
MRASAIVALETVWLEARKEEHDMAFDVPTFLQPKRSRFTRWLKDAAPACHSSVRQPRY